MADLSVLSGALSGLSLLLGIALLSTLSILTWKVTQIGKAIISALAGIEAEVSLSATKLSFIEFRLDRATVQPQTRCGTWSLRSLSSTLRSGLSRC